MMGVVGIVITNGALPIRLFIWILLRMQASIVPDLDMLDGIFIFIALSGE